MALQNNVEPDISRSDVPVKKSFIGRQLHGTAFLSLEHAGYLAAVIAVSLLVTLGASMAITLWSGVTNLTYLRGDSMLGWGQGMPIHAPEPLAAILVVAALLVLAPTMVMLGQRTRAEFAKRPGYTQRLGYRLPIYAALGVIGVAVVVFKIQLLAVIIASLALIGVSGAAISDMYLYHFIPALIGLSVFSTAGWYIVLLAKGYDNGKTFCSAISTLSVIIIVTLLLTAVLALHTKAGSDSQINSGMYNMPRMENLFR